MRTGNSILLALALVLTACAPHGERPGRNGTRGQAAGLPSEGALNEVPLGDLAGAGPVTLATRIANPYAGSRAAQQTGRQLYEGMNCAGCHGYDATGGMGPDLTDAAWRYGGSPAEIYKSIAEGRPKGMPAWGRALPEQEIWNLVAYIQTLGGAVPPRYAQAAREGDWPAAKSGISTLKGNHGED